MSYQSTKIIELGSCAFRQWRAESHCKFVHGYRLIAKFWFGANELDHRNWVVDFGGLKDLKQILESQFDHTLCVADDDPLLSDFKSLAAKGGCDLRVMNGGVGIEKTAEWCFNNANAYIRKITSDRCWVERVEVWEHDKNSAIYSVDQKIAYNTVSTVVQPNITTTPNEPITTSVGAPAPAVVEAINKQQGPIPAPVGNKVTTGYSNPFGGTSWGV